MPMGLAAAQGLYLSQEQVARKLERNVSQQAQIVHSKHVWRRWSRMNLPRLIGLRTFWPGVGCTRWRVWAVLSFMQGVE
jgi:hypothetical protein